MTEVTETTVLDLDQAGEQRIVRVGVDSRTVVVLLRDLLLAEYDKLRYDSRVIDVEIGVLTDALAQALARFEAKPHEPWSPAARVIGTRGEDEESLTYARVGAVWVSPDDEARRSWADLVVEYDVLVVESQVEGR